MKTPPAIVLIVIAVCLTSAQAQRQRPKQPLETGAERKRGVVYKTVDNRKLELDMYYPPGDAKWPCPVIVYTHGGGWAAGSRFGTSNGLFGPIFKALIKRGFCVVSVDYRLCRGGTIRMRDCVIDSKDAVRYLVKNRDTLNIDAKRLFVFGDSAGGHIAQMLLLTPPDTLTGDASLAKIEYKVVAGVSWYGPCDFEKEELFNHDDRPNFRDRFGPRILGDGEVTPKEKLRLYRAVSPINYLKNNSPPQLMIQGDKDTTIPVKHAHYMETKGKQLDASVQTLIVQNAGHNWRKVGADFKPSSEEILKATVKFSVAHLK